MKNSKNTTPHDQKYFVFLSFLAILFLVLVFVFPSKSNAQVIQCPLSGWGWAGYVNPNLGDNGSNYLRDMEGMGWLSFSGTSSGAGGGTYEVVKEPNGDLTGYAWSSNVGWIRFGGLSGFPAGGGNAKLVGNSSITGWARACAVFASDCSGALAPNYYRGGWDGWISLSGGSYGITYNSNNEELSGWAWGGDVVGWLSFRGANYGATLASGNNCVTTGGGSFDYNVTANPVQVPAPSGGTGSVTIQPSVGINLAPGSSNPQDVEVTGITVKPGYLPPSGVRVENIDTGTSCRPNTSCSIDISFDVDFDGSYNPSSGNSFRLEITTDNVPSGLPSPKTTDLRVTINNNSTGSTDACTVSPPTTLVGQSVTWTAPSNNLNLLLPVTYTWHHSTNPNTPIATGPVLGMAQSATISNAYPTLGSKHAYVDICSGATCRPSEVCTLRVIPIPVIR